MMSPPQPSLFQTEYSQVPQHFLVGLGFHDVSEWVPHFHCSPKTLLKFLGNGVGGGTHKSSMWWELEGCCRRTDSAKNCLSLCMQSLSMGSFRYWEHSFRLVPSHRDKSRHARSAACNSYACIQVNIHRRRWISTFVPTLPLCYSVQRHVMSKINECSE